MLQLGHTPRLAGKNLLMTRTEQKQGGYHRNAKGFLDPALLSAHLVFPQSQVRLEVPSDLLHWPPTLIRTHHLSRRPLGEIGHEDFRMFRADVPPFFTQDHRDITNMPQTQAFAVYPKRLTALGARQAWDPGTLIIFAGQMRHQVFERLIFDGFPRAGKSENKAPAPYGVLGITLHDHFAIGLGAIGSIALDDHPLGPNRCNKMAYHLTKQRIFWWIFWMVF